LRVSHVTVMQSRLSTPEAIAASAGAAMPFLRLPERGSVFAERAARLRALAPGHAIEGYLQLVATIADAQHALLARMPPLALPSPVEIAQCNEHGMPPLNFQTHRRDPQWCDALRHLLREVAAATEGAAHGVVTALDAAHDELYEAQASKLLAGMTPGLDLAAAPLIGAGLQVYFTHLAIALGAGAFPRIDIATICPCCGTRPTASVTRIGGGDAGYRFLHCALCNVEWHFVRVKCSNCESTKGVAYEALDDGTPLDRKAVLAETCDECGTYLKIGAMDRDPAFDPVADDLATLALDLLLDHAGKRSSGVNFMLLHGDPDAA
jgi:FdhE protein